MEDWQKLAAMKMKGEGRSEREIGRLLNVPKSTVHDFLSEKYDTKVALRNRLAKPEGCLRVLAMSDSHAGSKVGLTPPQWMFNNASGMDDSRGRIRTMQEEMWDWYTSTLKDIGPVDILFHLGDAIEGKAKKDGSSGLITASLMEQVDIAEEVISQVKATNRYMVYGTSYHVSENGEDFEAVLAKNLKATIDGRLWVDVNGIVFDLRHHVGSSSVPNGRAGSLSKEWVWNTFWKEKGLQSKSDIFLRGHIHYHTEVSGVEFKAMSLPSLQGPETIFGQRRCSSTVDFGMVVFDVPADAELQDVTYRVYNKNLKTFTPCIYSHGN